MSQALPTVTLRILRHIEKYGPISKDVLTAQFGDDSEPRIRTLYANGYIEHVFEENSSRSKGLTTTTKGRNTIQDSNWANWDWVKNSILVPIVVAACTAWLTTLGK